MLVVDTGVLLAAADDSDRDHVACADVVETIPGSLVTSPLVVAEAGYLIERQLGPEAEAGFDRSIANGDLLVEVLIAEAVKPGLLVCSGFRLDGWFVDPGFGRGRFG